MAGAVTKKWLEGILNKKVESFEMGAGTNLGDNFYSVLHSIKVIVENDSVPKFLLLKAYPSHAARQQFLEDTNVFEKELLIYTSYIPALTSFIQENTTNKDDKDQLILPFAPLVHGICKEPSGPEDELTKYLLMVDLRKTWGMKMADRYAGLDFDHCKVLIKELAKIHAVSWCYKEKKGLGSLREKYPCLKDSIICSEQRDLMNTWMEQRFNLTSPLLEKGIGSDSPAFKGFQKIRENATEVMLDYLENMEISNENRKAGFLRVKPAEYGSLSNAVSWKVGCHGDVWTNNLLFLYDDKGIPTKVTLVDLQLYREACPTTDLAMIFYTSTTHETRVKYLDNLLEIYAEYFIKYCKILKTDPLPGFNFDELKKRYHRTKPFGILIGTLYMPNVLQPQDCAQDLDKAEGQDMADVYEAIDKKLSNNTLISERIVEMVKEFYEEGVI